MARSSAVASCCAWIWASSPARRIGPARDRPCRERVDFRLRNRGGWASGHQESRPAGAMRTVKRSAADGFPRTGEEGCCRPSVVQRRTRGREAAPGLETRQSETGSSRGCLAQAVSLPALATRIRRIAKTGPPASTAAAVRLDARRLPLLHHELVGQAALDRLSPLTSSAPVMMTRSDQGWCHPVRKSMCHGVRGWRNGVEVCGVQIRPAVSTET